MVEEFDKFKRIIITERFENCNQNDYSATTELINIFQNRVARSKSKSKFCFPSANKKPARSKSNIVTSQSQNEKILCLCDYSKNYLLNQSADQLDIQSQNKKALDEIDKKVFNWYDCQNPQSIGNMANNQNCFVNKPRSVSRLTSNGVECCRIRSFQELNSHLEKATENQNITKENDMFGHNYRKINQSIEVLDDFNSFMSQNAPSSFMASNPPDRRSMPRNPRKNIQLSYRSNDSNSIDWNYEIGVAERARGNRNSRRANDNPSQYDSRRLQYVDRDYNYKAYDYEPRFRNERSRPLNRKKKESTNHRDHRHSRNNFVEIIDLSEKNSNNKVFIEEYRSRSESKVQPEYEKLSRSPSREHLKKFSLSSSNSLIDKPEVEQRVVNKPVEVAVNTVNVFDPFEEQESVKELKLQLKELKNQIDKLQTAQATLANTIKEKEQTHSDYAIDAKSINVPLKKFESFNTDYKEFLQSQEKSQTFDPKILTENGADNHKSTYMPVFNEHSLIFNNQPINFQPTVSTLTYDELFQKMNQPPELIEKPQEPLRPELTLKSKTNIYNMLNTNDEPLKPTPKPQAEVSYKPSNKSKPITIVEKTKEPLTSSSKPHSRPNSKPPTRDNSKTKKNSSDHKNLYERLLKLVSQNDKNSSKWNDEMYELLSNPEMKTQLKQLYKANGKPGDLIPSLEKMLLQNVNEKKREEINIGKNTINVFNIQRSKQSGPNPSSLSSDQTTSLFSQATSSDEKGSQGFVSEGTFSKVSSSKGLNKNSREMITVIKPSSKSPGVVSTERVVNKSPGFTVTVNKLSSKLPGEGMINKPQGFINDRPKSLSNRPEIMSVETSLDSSLDSSSVTSSSSISSSSSESEGSIPSDGEELKKKLLNVRNIYGSKSSPAIPIQKKQNTLHDSVRKIMKNENINLNRKRNK